MTSSGFNNNNNNNNAVMISSLPSPPISSRQSTMKMPAFMLDRAPLLPLTTTTTTSCNNRSPGGLVSDIRSTSYYRGRHEDELRPLLYQQQQDGYCLPPIQNVMFMDTPTSSPSPPPSYGSYYLSSSSTSPPSTCMESPPSTAASDEEELLNSSSIRRKGSIASLLNSDPELKQLDEEESRCNYQSHFFDNYSLKRGRPPSTVHHIDDSASVRKKQRIDMLDSSKQACQSPASNTATCANYTTTNDSTRATKGLRHFSKQVCDKVAKKGITTYNEVADELAFDIQQSSTVDGKHQKQNYDQKNIRRRVYDALNVLMAMNIIAKDKKVIKWLGIPECYKQQEEEQDHTELLNQIKAEELRSSQLLGSLQVLRSSINSKLEKHTHIRNLIKRNQSSTVAIKEQQKLPLPLFMICSSENSISSNLKIDMQDDNRSATVSFKQEQPNQQIVYEDIDILQCISL